MSMGLNSYWWDFLARHHDDPENVKARRQEAVDHAALIVRNTPCGDCGASTGTPCAGLTDAVHYGRQMRYATTGWFIPC